MIILIAPIRKLLGRVKRIVNRVILWLKVATRMSGADSNATSTLFRAILASPLTILQDLDDYQMPMVDNECIVKAKGKGLFVIRPFTDDLYSVLPEREEKVERYIRSKLKKGSVFVGAGSNIGYYSILASRIVGNNGKVIACEMMPETLVSLQKNIEINRCQNIIVVPKALSFAGNPEVTAHFNCQKLGSSTISNQFIDTNSIKDRHLKVESTTLKEVLVSIDSVDCLKMDIEGAEMDALLGLGSSVTKVRSIVFECRSGPAPLDWLRSKGFSVRMVDACNAAAENLSFFN